MWKSNGRKRRGGERQEEKRIQAWGHSPLCCPVLESVRLSCWQGTKTPGSAFCPWAASWPSKKPFVCCGFSGTAGGLRWVLQVTGGSMGCLPASPGVRGGSTSSGQGCPRSAPGFLRSHGDVKTPKYNQVDFSGDTPGTQPLPGEAYRKPVTEWLFLVFKSVSLPNYKRGNRFQEIARKKIKQLPLISTEQSYPG